jgi:dihydroflavonol-4-reductase
MAGREVFLTGATGFIGGRLTERLLGRGDRLRCLVRNPSAATRLEARGVKLVEGDISDPVALEHGLRGAQLAYHLAALYDVGVVDEAAMERINVDGTQAFVRAIEHQHTPRAVYVSSTAALGPAGAGDSETPWKGPYPTLYHRTKAQAHRIARDAQRRGVPLIIVSPANVYGPGDNGPNGRFMRDIARGRVPGLLRDPGWYSYVHVDDVVDALVAAGDVGRPGEHYILAGEALDVNSFADRVARLAGRRAPRLRLPTGVALLGGTLLDKVARATGRRFVMSREIVALGAGHRWLHESPRAAEELGFRPRSLEEGLPETVASYGKRTGHGQGQV